MQTNYPCLNITQTDAILTITINRPEALNAINREVMQSLHDLFLDLPEMEGVLGIILTGAGDKAFAAGADIKEFSFDGGAAREISAFGHKTFDQIEACPIPVVAAINGFALGGGCELAMACHIRVAAVHAKFGQPEIKLGLVPGYGGTQRLPQLVGRGRALEILLTGTNIDAQRAWQIGLVNKVVAADELLTETRTMLGKITMLAPLAAAQIISLVDAHYTAHGAFDKEIEAFQQSFDTEDAKEGVHAFKEKRKPVFEGK